MGVKKIPRISGKAVLPQSFVPKTGHTQGVLVFTPHFSAKLLAGYPLNRPRGSKKAKAFVFGMLKRIRKEKKGERFQKTVPTLLGQQSGE